MTLVTKNLGLVKAIHEGTSAPSNTSMIWYNVADEKHYVYDSDSVSWVLLAGSVQNFTDLSDAPNSFSGSALKVLKVKADESGLEFVEESVSATDLSFGINTATSLAILSSTGVGVVLDSATLTLAGLMSAADKTKTDYITISNPINIDSIVTLSGVAANSTHLGTFTGSTISDNSTNKTALQELETAVELRISGNGTSGYLPKYTGSLTQAISNIYDSGTAIGIFTSSPLWNVGIDGNSARTFGLNRHTVSNTAGNSLSIYAGGATSGATNKNAGNLDLYSGASTGTGTGSINFYTSPAGVSGTTDNAQTLKLNINGAGTSEFFTSTANSKWKAGHNQATILAQTTGVGIMFARPSDGSYTVHGGIFASATSDMLTFSGFGAGFRFVRNPSSDTIASITIGGSSLNGGCNMASGVAAGGTGTITYDFINTFTDTGNNIASRIRSVGTNTGVADTTALRIDNVTTSSTAGNNGLYIDVTGSTYSLSRRNYALNIVNGHIVAAGTTTGLYLGTSVDPAIKAYINGTSTTNEVLYVVSNSITSGTTNLLVALSTNSAAVNKNGLFLQVQGSSNAGGNRAAYIYRGNLVTDSEATGGNTQIGIGTLNPNSAAAIEIVSTTKGFLTSRMTSTQASAITPTNGLSLYVTDTNATFTSIGFWGYEAGAWKKYTLV